MSYPGFGVMIQQLFGGRDAMPADHFYGRVIASAKFGDESLTLAFTDGTQMKLTDEGQSCCENRYMTTDDDVQSLVGQTLTRIEARDGPDAEDEYDAHEQVFVEVGTDRGFITITTHNEHNGYYGGFALQLAEVRP